VGSRQSSSRRLQTRLEGACPLNPCQEKRLGSDFQQGESSRVPTADCAHYGFAVQERNKSKDYVRCGGREFCKHASRNTAFAPLASGGVIRHGISEGGNSSGHDDGAAAQSGGIRRRGNDADMFC